MTDKQIIIDGVDVSGCIYYKATGKYNTCGYDCELTHNCYYKQLKAKEQECEELKKITNEAKNSKLDLKSFLVCEAVQNEYEQQLDQLKAENDELKRYKSLFEKTRDLWNEASKTNYKLLDEIEDLKDSLKRTICQSECYRYKEAEKLKQTLTEIKEIAEKIDDSAGCAYGDYDCDNCSSLEQETVCTYKVKKLILQKISEVEND